MKNIAIFASGSGSNFEALATACASGKIPARVAVCVCDKAGAGVIARAQRLDIPVMVVNPKDFPSKQEYEKAIADRLDLENVELVCLAGYMRIVGEQLLRRYGGRIINIHPALLPAFKGAHAIQDAFDYGVKVYGVTIHFIDHTIDGGTIIAQTPVCYDGNDIQELETMIHKAEHLLYTDTVAALLKEKTQ